MVVLTLSRWARSILQVFNVALSLKKLEVYSVWCRNGHRRHYLWVLQHPQSMSLRLLRPIPTSVLSLSLRSTTNCGALRGPSGSSREPWRHVLRSTSQRGTSTRVSASVSWPTKTIRNWSGCSDPGYRAERGQSQGYRQDHSYNHLLIVQQINYLSETAHYSRATATGPIDSSD